MFYLLVPCFFINKPIDVKTAINNSIIPIVPKLYLGVSLNNWYTPIAKDAEEKIKIKVA